MQRGVVLIIIIITLLGFNKSTAKPLLVLNRQLSIDSTADNSNTVIIPIKRAGNLIIVECQIDSLYGNFVLDTGAPYLVLNATYFRYLPHNTESESAGINGATNGCFKTSIRNFSIGLDLHYDKLNADVTDLSAIENTKKIKILGLLGTRLFDKMAITVDLQNNILYVHKLNQQNEIYTNERVINVPQLKTPFKYMNNVVFIKGQLNDVPLWFAFDTGAESNLLASTAPRKALKATEVINRSKLTGVGGSSFEIIYARFDRLAIGNQVFLSNRILITDLNHISKAYGYSVDAILGYDFFTRGVFTINFAKKEFEMYIYKHSE